uniref:glycosyltransferase family 2 protein n=1 Tax=Arthrobacter sp. 68b TaxID=311808 RepID=UPI00349ECEDC
MCPPPSYLDGTGQPQEWIWLVPRGSSPAPNALAELLGAVASAPSVGVAGCKQLDGDGPERLIDVGLSVGRWGWGNRLTLIDDSEVDIGQYDGRSDTFGVSLSGMLIRRDIWDRLQGFDPALPDVGADIDFCWRCRLAGSRVIVVPGAKIYRSDAREPYLDEIYEERRTEIYLRLKYSPTWSLPMHVIGALGGGALKLTLSVFTMRARRGIAYLFGSFAAVAAFPSLLQSREIAALTQRIPSSSIRKLKVPQREIRSHRPSRRSRGFMAPSEPVSHANEPEVQRASLLGPLKRR